MVEDSMIHGSRKELEEVKNSVSIKKEVDESQISELERMSELKEEENT